MFLIANQGQPVRLCKLRNVQLYQKAIYNRFMYTHVTRSESILLFLNMVKADPITLARLKEKKINNVSTYIYSAATTEFDRIKRRACSITAPHSYLEKNLSNGFNNVV